MGKTFVRPLIATAASAFAPLRRGKSVMANIEAARSYRLSQRCSRLLVDMRAQLALHDRIQKREHLAFFTADLKLDPPVRQISDPADDIEALGDLANGPTKPDALHIAFVKNLKRDHARG